jgi:hypothetical protein
MSSTLASPARGPASALPEIPSIATRMAYAGLAPFVVGAVLALLVHTDVHPLVARALAAYATAVIAFLGGVHWGLAMQAGAQDRAAWLRGVVPTAVAAIAVLMPPDAGLVIDGIVIVAGYLVDRRVYPCVGLARWLTLRFRLTVLGTLACFLAAAGA